MFRKNLIDLLLDHPQSITQIARQVRESPGQIEDDLEHLFKSLKHTEYEAHIDPAQCRKCHFQFSTAKLSKPSRCPECLGSWLTEPKISIHLKTPPGQR
jgi:transcriptional regulator